MFSRKMAVRHMTVATVGAGAMVLGAVAPAQAQPNCTAADLSGIMSGITAATSAYLFTHPPVNEFFTTLGDVPDEEKKDVLVAFLNSNPQVKAELSAIRQPAKDFRNRCDGGVPRPVPGTPAGEIVGEAG